jgi:hypothetical protein
VICWHRSSGTQDARRRLYAALPARMVGMRDLETVNKTAGRPASPNKVRLGDRVWQPSFGVVCDGLMASNWSAHGGQCAYTQLWCCACAPVRRGLLTYLSRKGMRSMFHAKQHACMMHGSQFLAGSFLQIVSIDRELCIWLRYVWLYIYRRCETPYGKRISSRR